MKIYNILQNGSDLTKCMKKILCKIGNWLCSRYCENNVDWAASVNWEKLWKNRRIKDKIDFVYDNAINVLKELDDNKKEMQKRSMLILTYLFSICGALLYLICASKVDDMDKTILHNIVKLAFNGCVIQNSI